MSTEDTEVNRNIDGETAEGHARMKLEEAELRASKRTEKRSNTLDDEAEGHVRARVVGEADEAVRRI